MYKYISFSRDNLLDLEKIDSVIIIGSSWSGKTTIRNILEQILPKTFCFPKRYITRARRPADDLNENGFVEDLESLKNKIPLGVIWERDLGESVEYYGFELPVKDSIPVYSANNALVKSSPAQGGELIRSALVVLVSAPDSERRERAIKRDGSHLDGTQQKGIRMGDTSLSTQEYSHIIVDNANSVDHKIQAEELYRFFTSLGSARKHELGKML